MQDINIQDVRTKLLRWSRISNDRPMPWKGEKDPYKIWLSEIILQQTRVEQGLRYYNNYVAKYPTIIDLANAKDDDVFKDWEGLGYYNRCRNMLFTARLIRDEYEGIFPDTYDKILALKGVGSYTAAAISSFAYNLPFAVVDGNVVRVLSRLLALDRQLISAADKKTYQELADQFLSKRKAGAYNQAIMDFGATLCTPQNPSCATCPLKANCSAYAMNAVDKFPPKKPKIKLKKRVLHYVLYHNKNAVYLRKRSEKGIWASLYEPILIEQNSKPSWLKNVKAAVKTSQKLSHQHLIIYFYILNKDEPMPISLASYQKINLKNMSDKAYPRSVAKFLNDFEYI